MGEEIDSILITAIGCASIIISMYLPSLFATKITLKISEIGDIIYNERWYTYPNALQMYVILIIQNSQRNRYLSGFNIVYCNVETFGKVNAKKSE